MQQTSSRGDTSYDFDNASDLACVVELMEEGLERHAPLVLQRAFAGYSGENPAAEPGAIDTFHLPPEQRASVLHGIIALGHDMLARVRTGASLPTELPADSALMVRLWARDGEPLAVLLDALLHGQELFSKCSADAIEKMLEDPAARWTMLCDAQSRAAGYTQRISQLVRGLYEAERSERLTVHKPPTAAALVARVLNGEDADSGQLGYRLEGPHLAVVTDSRKALHLLARHTGRGLLDVSGHHDLVWGWLGGERLVANTELDALICWQRSHEGRVAFGEPAMGPGGFRSSLRNALAAWRIACALHLPVVRFADESLLIAITRDRHYAHSFIEHYLGNLSDTLREAVSAYVELGQNVASASARLSRSRRTVERQLRRVEDELGRPIRDCASELLIATRAADVMGADDYRAGQFGSELRPADKDWLLR
jgi:hypothetical protein